MKTLKDVHDYLVEKAAPSDLIAAIDEAQDVVGRLVEWGDQMGGWEAGGAFDAARRLLNGHVETVVVCDGKDHVCGNCELTWDDHELDQIKDIWERVEPGDVMPSGECPDCGALCYPAKGGA